VTRLERFSERYQPTGGLAAEGVLNQLGRPNTEPLEVLVREAVQNCWDAGRDAAIPVEVEFGFRTLEGGMLDVLRERVLSDPPPGHSLKDELSERVGLLHVADFGTSGLGGPTRADAEPTGKMDFVDFVRNVGQPPDTELGGGSFGYGKAAFYLASRASTIIVDTYCAVERERRLIAYGLGEHYRADGVAFTGRHWWGVPVDGVPEPLTGDAATALAGSLGLPLREGDRYGTTVAIVAPYLASVGDNEQLTSREALEFIGECLIWNFWPKMTAAPGVAAAMKFRLIDEGEEILPDDPRTHPQLRPFVEAMDLLREDREVPAGDMFSIRSELHSQRPRQALGTLAVRQAATASEAVPSTGPVTRGALGTASGLHHVALMRNAELVVRYESGPPPLVPGRGYAGVFRCDRELDEIFRRSEPPTHDAWISKTLPERRERTFVNVTLNRINELLRELTTPSVDLASAAVSRVSVGRFADDLAGLMPGLDGPGAGRVSTGPGGGEEGRPNGGGRGRSEEDGGSRGGSSALDDSVSPHILVVGAPELQVDKGGGIVIRTPFSLETAGCDARVSASVEVLTMDGGQVETEPPIDGVIPDVVGWVTPEREIRGGGSALARPSESGEWEVRVGYEPDLMIRVAIDVEVKQP